MIEAKPSLVAPVEAVNHVLYALDVAPIGDVGREARAARWACCPRWRGWWWRLLRLQAACWAARQPGRACRVRRRHRGADGLDGQLDGGQPSQLELPSQRLERGRDARWGGGAQRGGDRPCDRGHRVRREPVRGLQTFGDQVGGVVAVVGQQVGLVVLGSHGKLGLKQHGIKRCLRSSSIGQQLSKVLLVEARVEQVGVRVGRGGLWRTHADVRRRARRP